MTDKREIWTGLNNNESVTQILPGNYYLGKTNNLGGSELDFQ